MIARASGPVCFLMSWMINVLRGCAGRSAPVRMAVLYHTIRGQGRSRLVIIFVMKEWQILDANERLDRWIREHPSEMALIARQAAQIVRRINEEDRRAAKIAAASAQKPLKKASRPRGTKVG